MGELNQHQLSNFKCNILIETGTGIGTGLEYACTYPFEQIHTIEIIPELYNRSKEAVKDNRISFHLGDSISVLDQILPSFKDTDRILFWVDAHFPGVDFGLGIKKYVFDEENIPSEKELAVIKRHRKNSKDSIILDDLRLYENGNYQAGDLDIGKQKSGIGFVENLFSQTHNIWRDYRSHGSLIIIPKE